jgi:glycogen synthase
MSMDSTIEYRLESADLMTKMDFTVGIKPKPRTKLMLQVQTGLLSGSDPFLRLAPSIARQFGKGRHVVLEAQFGVINDDKAAIKLGTWLEF